jgi:hypothetical protein
MIKMKKCLYVALLSALIPYCFAYSQAFTTSLPIVKIKTPPGQPINDEPGVVADFTITYKGEGVSNSSTETPTYYVGKAKVEWRGCSSQNFPKKSIGVELRLTEDVNENREEDLFGFGVDNDWVLNASYTDKTFVRDALTMYMSNQAGMYAPQTKYIEVFIDDVYQGIYVLEEKIKRGVDRVNITKLKKSEISGDALTGGYLLKIDKHCGTDNSDGWSSVIASPGGNPGRRHEWMLQDPKKKDVKTEQLTYIKNYIDEFEAAVNGSNSCDLVNGYEKYIDVNSFVDYFLIQEVVGNADAYRFSTYFTKDRLGKLKAGPVWDLNLALGFLATTVQTSTTQGWVYSGPGDANFPVPFFWSKLFACPEFKNKVKQRYRTFRNSVWHTSQINSFVEAQYALLNTGPLDRNFVKWPTLGTVIWNGSFVGATVASEKDHLKSWLTQRMIWLDNELLGGPLPVTFSDFKLTKNDGIVNVDWATTTEDDNSYFEVERSSNGFTFDAIARLDGKINSKAEVRYSFVDHAPLEGISYYRIRQVDLDGTSSITRTRSIEMPYNAQAIIFPNPAADFLTLDKIEPNSMITLITSLGQEIRKETAKTGTWTMNLDGLPSGFYTVSITTKNGTIHKKLVISR